MAEFAKFPLVLIALCASVSCTRECVPGSSSLESAERYNALPSTTPVSQPREQILTLRHGQATATVRVVVSQMKSDDRLLTLFPDRAIYTPTRAITAISIRIGDHVVFVPPMAVLDIFDPNTFSLSNQAGHFVLTVEGADGVESYGVRLWFDDRNVFQRDDYSSDAPQQVHTLKYSTAVMDVR